MSRRSTRLLSGGYYHSDEESDSSSVTTISYRENPVKVFKKKSGGRKKRSEAEDSPSSRTSADTQPAEWRPVSRPALRSPASASSSPLTSSNRPVQSQLQSEPAQSAVDSSGYSSSEDPLRGPGSSSSSGAVKCAKTSREWLQNTVCKLKDTVPAALSAAVSGARSSTLAQKVGSWWPFTASTGARSWSSFTAGVTNPRSTARFKHLFGLILVLLLLLGAWWTSLLSGLSSRSKPSLTLHPPHPQPGLQLTTLDAATVSAAVETKLQLIQREMRLKHDLLLAELKQQMQMELQLVKERERTKEEERKKVQRESEERAEKEKEREEREREARGKRESEQREEVQRMSQIVSSLQELQTHSERATASHLLTLSALEDKVSQLEQKEKRSMSPEFKRDLDLWLNSRLQEQAAVVHALSSGACDSCQRPLADKMADFALESQGASVVSTRCSETYRTRSACVSLFGFPLWYPSESPRTVIQGPAVLLPGKCWAFHGVQGTLVIALSHPIRISHVSLDHLPRHSSPTGRIDSAPKDFQVYGMADESEQGTLLGTFRYDEAGDPTQTFSLSGLTEAVYHMVELRILSNWGHVQYTCVYRFRVHGQLALT